MYILSKLFYQMLSIEIRTQLLITLPYPNYVGFGTQQVHLMIKADDEMHQLQID